MLTLPLTYEDFRQVARLCQPIDVGRVPRGFDFKSYLVQLLRPLAPAAAARLQGLSGAEVELLRGEIAELQDMVA